jgi:hypothetical protein
MAEGLRDMGTLLTVLMNLNLNSGYDICTILESYLSWQDFEGFTTINEPSKGNFKSQIQLFSNPIVKVMY